MLKSKHLRRPVDFLDSLLGEYLFRGLGSMQKRDVEVLFIHLILKDGLYGDDIDFYKMSHQLGVSENRLKKLVYDSQIRYHSYSEEKAKDEFIDLMQKGSFFIDRYKRINFLVRSPMLRQYLEEWVSRFSGLIDTSFNRSFVKISIEDLSKVMEGLTTNPKTMEIVIRNLDEDDDEKGASEYIGDFLKKFFIEKAEETSGHSIEYAGLVLRQLILGF